MKATLLKSGHVWMAFLALLCIASASALHAQPDGQERTASGQVPVFAADDFVDSEGINTHLSSKAYTADPQMPAFIKRLGIRHVRDGILLKAPRYVARLNSIAIETGVKYDFITDGGANAFGQSQDAGTIADFVRAVPATEAIEAPNEYDNRCCAWSKALLGYLPTLKAANAGVPVIGPALDSAYAYDLVGDVSEFVDFTNIHDYFGGFPPETKGFGGPVFGCGTTHHGYCGNYGSLATNENLAKVTGQGLPIYATETGYGTGEGHGSIDLATQALYIPRLFFFQFANGIKRTYVFQLVDFYGGNSGYQKFGLLEAAPDYRSHTPKPAYTILAAINQMLSDPGAKFPVSPPPASLSNLDAHTEALWLEKRDGTYWLAIWSGKSAYDIDGHPPGDTPIAPMTATLHCAKRATATAYSFDSSGNRHVRTYGPGVEFPVVVGGGVSLVELRL